MMHCLGFVHEHQRQDSNKHHNAAKINDQDFITCSYYKSIGHYDYKSIMHYGNDMMKGHYKDKKTANEMKKYIGKSTTFSKGDVAAIKWLYGPNGSHYGEWHRPCIPGEGCDNETCFCSACGQSTPWCGFAKENVNGHWTCCLSEDRESTECNARKWGHTGFWFVLHCPFCVMHNTALLCRHMECEKSCLKSQKGECNCGACGVGCKHIGKAAHWSCCYQEKFEARCKQEIAQ